MNLQEQRQKVREYVEKSLALWSSTGYDSERCTFIEALDFDGTPLTTINRRGRVQARQVYVYALAHLWGFDPDGKYLEIAKQTWDSTKDIYLTKEGGWIFSATYEGHAVDSTCFVYERTFTIMALAALHHATGDPAYEAQIDAALTWIQTNCASPNGGYELGVPLTPSVPREQNPHMHLFESCIESGGLCNGKFKTQGEEIYALALQHFITPTGALIEFFTEDWQPDPKTGADLQPGHLMEWTWLLTQYSKVTGEAVPQIELIYNAACKWGLAANGLGYDEARKDGTVLRASKRLWVQCEVIKGHCARFESTNDRMYLERAQNAVTQMFDGYLHESGSWFDQLDENGKNISLNAPASSLYHLFIALHEFLRVSE